MTAWFAPGRIEVLGKHTDYAGGQSLLAALDRGVTVTVTDADAWSARSDAVPGVLNLDDAALPPGHWGRYVQTVRSRLERNFGPLRPSSVHVASDLPLASGMSSSSALVVASALALAHHHGFPGTDAWHDAIQTPEDLATYLACIENGSDFRGLTGDAGVGTFGGSEDHTAMLGCRAGQLSRFRFAPTVRLGDAPVPDGLAFVVAVSGVLAEKTGAAREAYNASALAAREIAARWRERSGRPDATIGAALTELPDAAERLTALVADDPRLATRLRHFLLESEELVPGASAALEAGDLAAFGDLCATSQRAAAEWLGNQVAPTVRLADRARALGAVAASSFGAGFGGSVWALVGEADAAEFGRAWLADHLAAHPDLAGAADVVIGVPSGPARPVTA